MSYNLGFLRFGFSFVKYCISLIFFILTLFFNSSSCGHPQNPEINFQPLTEILVNSTSQAISKEFFQVNICTVAVDCLYGILLGKGIIVGEVEVYKRKKHISDIGKAPFYLVPVVLIISNVYGVQYIVFPVVIDSFLRNLYSFFSEDLYLQDVIVKYGTHIISSCLLTMFNVYGHPSNHIGTIKYFIDSMFSVFIFQNYGVVALFVSITTSQLLNTFRIKMIGW